MTIFLEITLVMVVVLVVSLVMRLLKQPLVVGYILSGILVGPVALNIIHSHDTIELLSKFGITILLFIVGLHLSPKVIKEVGSVSIITGVGQVLFTSVFGFLIALMLDIPTLSALYVAIALTFSSTIIILKLLSDKGQTQSLYGKIAIGFLLVQDVIATIILIIVSSFSDQNTAVLPTIALLILKSLGILLGLFILMNWLLPKLTHFVSKSQELLFVFSLTWGLSLAALFHLVGLSVEIGALLAGVAVSGLPFADEMSSRLRPLRDFFIILFFIYLGSSMTFGSIGNLIIPVVVLSLFVLIGNPVIVIIITNLLGYHKKTSFMAGLTVAQISEFSLILATLGMKLGHLSAETLTMITLVGLATIAGSTYLILYSDQIYPRVDRWLTFLELKKHNHLERNKRERLDIMLFGCERTSQIFIKFAKKMDYTIGFVNLNPDLQDEIQPTGAEYFFGDASDKEFISDLPLNNSKVVISSIPSVETNVMLIKHLRANKYRAAIIIFANSNQEKDILRSAGGDVIVLPHEHAAHYVVRKLSQRGLNKSAFA